MDGEKEVNMRVIQHQTFERETSLKRECLLNRVGPRAYFGRAAARPFFCFKKTVRSSATISSEISPEQDIETRYSESLDRPLVETDIKVRSTIGYRKEANHAF